MSVCCRIRTTPSSSTSNSTDYSFTPSTNHSFSISVSPIITQRRRKLGFLLRSSEPSKLWITQSSNQGKTDILRSLDEGEAFKARDCLNALGEVAEESIFKEEKEEEKRIHNGCTSGDYERDRKVEIMLAASATVVLGVGNRVLYKLALVPLKHYPFFLAQLATFG